MVSRILLSNSHDPHYIYLNIPSESNKPFIWLTWLTIACTFKELAIFMWIII